MSEPTLTNKGIALMQKGLQGETITFTKFKIGNGNPGDTDVKTLEDIVNPIKTIGLDRIDRPNNGNNVVLVGKGYTNSGIESDTRWNEIGVYADDPDDGEILFAYINAENEIEILKSEQCGISMENNLSVMLLISSEINVTAVIAGIQYATKEEFLQHTSARNPHGTDKSDVGLDKIENRYFSEQVPSFTTGQRLTNLAPGDDMEAIASKLWSAINTLSSHLIANNPHNLKVPLFGYFIGNGEGKRKITLPFTPSAVLLLNAHGMTGDDVDKTCGGLALPGHNLIARGNSISEANQNDWVGGVTALMITEEGFFVSYYGDCRTNNQSQSYSYIAWQ